MTNLSQSTLDRLPAGIRRPAYDLSTVRVGIVHLGLGAFHRAHQAVFTDDVLASDPRWGICGVSMKTPRSTLALAAQDGLYTVVLKDAEAASTRVVGALRETVFAGDDTSAIAARLADPRVSVVTLTVTEKGYCRNASGGLDFAHPDIAHDVAHPHAPRSAIGLLVAALGARRDTGAGGITIVCCDNLPANGRALERLVGELASQRDDGLAAWIADHATFPSTMVDRIVPATTPADVADVERTLGMHDAAPVVAEPFSQWVIERRFAAAMPDWASAGATLVADVEPFETMKLRMLNGSHSTLAYLGFLRGHETIAGAATDPLLRAFVERQMVDEMAPSFAAPSGVDTSEYAHALMRRFRNPALPHRTAQVAMDGSQKLPQRWLATIRDNLAAGRSIERLALSVAAWMRYVAGHDERGMPIVVNDPLAPRFAAAAAAHRDDPRAFATALFGIESIFGGEIPRDPRVVEPVVAALRALLADGVERTLARFQPSRQGS